MKHYYRLLNVEFDLKRDGLASTELIQGHPSLIDYGTVKKVIGKMKN